MFDIDFEDGEVRCRSFSRYEKDGLSEGVIGTTLHLTNIFMDDYSPAVMAVIYGNKNPVDAIAEVEAQLQARDENEAE